MSPRNIPYLALIALLACGCRGVDLQLGVARTLNDFSGRASSSGKHGSDSDLSFDQDDSTSLYVGFDIALSDRTVIVKEWWAEELLYRSIDPGTPQVGATPSAL